MKNYKILVVNLIRLILSIAIIAVGIIFLVANNKWQSRDTDEFYTTPAMASFNNIIDTYSGHVSKSEAILFLEKVIYNNKNNDEHIVFVNYFDIEESGDIITSIDGNYNNIEKIRKRVSESKNIRFEITPYSYDENYYVTCGNIFASKNVVNNSREINEEKYVPENSLSLSKIALKRIEDEKIKKKEETIKTYHETIKESIQYKSIMVCISITIFVNLLISIAVLFYKKYTNIIIKSIIFLSNIYNIFIITILMCYLIFLTGLIILKIVVALLIIEAISYYTYISKVIKQLDDYQDIDKNNKFIIMDMIYLFQMIALLGLSIGFALLVND